MRYIPRLNHMDYHNHFLPPRVMYGYTSCLKDAAVGMCGGEYFDLLETMYEEVIVGVIGDAFDCNEENEPLFGEFEETRSVTEKNIFFFNHL